MTRAQNSSRETLRLLQALLAQAEAWRYGYDLSKETSLKSGTLYPILVRLERQGWLETRWESTPPAGRPARHLYKMTAEGVRKGVLLLDTARAREARSILTEGVSA